MMSENTLLSTVTDAQNQRVEITRVLETKASEVSDLITVEEPLEIRIAPHGEQEFTLSVTMRTPGADRELALGFLFGEGLITGPEDIRAIEHCGPPSPDKGLHNVIKVSLSQGVEINPAALERHTYTTSSCGVCGKTSIEAIKVVNPHPVEKRLTLDRETVLAIPPALRMQQREFAKTGGLHGVGLFDHAGRLLSVYEDVGRHNALDKLVGFLYGEGALPLKARGLVLSGRASFELLQKASIAGAELVLAVGPPSSLAAELAQEQGITLVGFVATHGFNIYTHPERIR